MQSAVRRQRSVARALWAAVAAVLVLAAGCSGDDDVAVPDDVVMPLASELGGVLGRLPAGPDGKVFVAATSLDAAASAVGTSRSCASVDAINGWMGTLFADGRDTVPWQPSMLQGATIGRLDDEFGVSLCDVDWVAQSLSYEPSAWLLSAEVDLDRVDRAIRSDAVWGEGTFTIDTSTGVEFYDWGDDIDFQRRTPFRDLGIGGQLAVFPDEADGEDVVVITRNHGDMVAAVQRGNTIADNPAVAIALPILAAADPISALLVDETTRWSEIVTVDSAPSAKAVADELGQPTWVLAPYDLLAAAQGRDGDGGFLEVVLVHRSALDAEANLGKLQTMFSQGASVTDEPGRPWRELLTIESVGSRDSVLIARLRAVDGAGTSAFEILLRSLKIGDSLFVSD